MFKNPDDINGYTLWHIFFGVLFGLLSLWLLPLSVVAFLLLCLWEWIEWSLRKYNIPHLDPHGVSIFDLFADGIGYIVGLLPYIIKHTGG